MASDAPSTQTSLSSLADWSKQHIRDVFEAPSNELTLRALDSAFSRSLEATVNGAPVDFDGFAKMIAAMSEHPTSPDGPKVDWIFADETPDDAGHRNGVVKGEYFIRGIFGIIPGSDAPVEIEARKEVVGRIESQSEEAGVDSRIIVKLDAIVSILPVDRSKAS
ncbi:hypothetical protein DFH07DRAFT_872876 [Mycena maculata]|uniref:Uncharacterized protein n=1 Tax=Mycena maculata TaxID=230809 RepID=A0AAD7KK24_9AGAR|nr:hypothetical protein DFH07DRAFT_872876 [Mycena maculata]